jgi:hypothetical protein
MDQQFEFRCRELYLGITGQDPARQQADGEVAATKRRLVPLGEADMGLHARDQLLEREGLDEVVDGSGVQAIDSILKPSACGQHDHRELRPLDVEHLHHFCTAQLWEH